MSVFTRLLRRRSHYRAVFDTPSGRAVLSDLARFCGHAVSPLVVSTLRQQVDPMATMVRVGRGEVFQRIVTQLNLSDERLLRMKEEEIDHGD